jgi:Sulfotransferase family
VRPPESSGRLPSFLVIGAIKAATSWISHHLRQTPAVFLPKGEPHYFTREFGRGLDWYMDLFAAAGPFQIVGEKTADYLANADAPKRASRLLPHASLIVSLRNPVDRAYSDYCMLYRRGSVSSRIENYLDPRRAETRRFLDNGLYHKHLRAWFDYYPSDRFLALTMDDVICDPAGSLHAISRFIGLPRALVPAAGLARVNDSKESFLPLHMRRLLAPFKRAIAPLRENAAFQRARATLARPIDYPDLSDELRLRLVDFYRDDVDRLQELLGRDLSSWTGPAARVAA